MSMRNTEQVVLERAVMVPGDAALVADRIAYGPSTAMDLHDLTNGHINVLMNAVSKFDESYGDRSEGHLHLTYNSEDVNVASLDDYTDAELRVVIGLLPGWFWDGTKVFLMMEDVPGLRWTDPGFRVRESDCDEEGE